MSNLHWQPDLFAGRGIQRAEATTRDEAFRLARQEMRDTNSPDLFDAIDELRIPCTDWSCPRPHDIRRNGPAFAGYHTTKAKSMQYAVKFGNRGSTGARELGGNGADPEPVFYVEAGSDQDARSKATAEYLTACLNDPTDTRHPNAITREFHHDNTVIDVHVA